MRFANWILLPALSIMPLGVWASGLEKAAADTARIFDKTPAPPSDSPLLPTAPSEPLNGQQNLPPPQDPIQAPQKPGAFKTEEPSTGRPKGFIQNFGYFLFSPVLSPVKGLVYGAAKGMQLAGKKMDQPLLEGPFSVSQILLGILGALGGLIVGIALIPFNMAKHLALAIYDLF